MSWLNKKMFIRLLGSIVSISNHTKCVFWSNRKCMTHPTLINLQSWKYTQGLCYYPFAVNLYICVESCNTFNGLSNTACVPNKKKRFESKRPQHSYGKKWIKNVNKTYLMGM